MKALVLLLLVVAIGLGYVVYQRDRVIDAQQVHIAALAAQASAAHQQVKTASLDLQAKCAEQARKAFAESGLKTAGPHISGYESHYNARLNKCFIDMAQTSVVNKVPSQFRSVYDAFEGRLYAIYFWRNPDDKKYSEVKPFKCEAIALTGETVECASSDEFDQLVNVYMETKKR